MTLLSGDWSPGSAKWGRCQNPYLFDQQLAARRMKQGRRKDETGQLKFSFPGEAVRGDSLIRWFRNAFVENKL